MHEEYGSHDRQNIWDGQKKQTRKVMCEGGGRSRANLRGW